MDRQISNNEQFKSKLGNWVKYIILICVVILAVFLLRNLLKKKADMNDFFIARVERGDIQNTVTASGVVQAAFEREINAPVNTEIKKVILPKGTLVKKNDLILELDQEYTQLEFDKLKDELQLRRNNVDKLKLKFDKDLRDLDYQNQIKGLQLSEFNAQVKDQKRLTEIGAATAEELEAAELKLKVANIEKQILENNVSYAKSVNVKEKESLELEYKIQEKRLQELRRKLTETSVRAPSDGVITWINENIGKTVTEGEALVRIADLSKYKIEASSSDRNAEKIQIGLPVNVRINKNTLTGTITTVLPEVINNTVRFIVELDKPNADILRPNLRVEVYLITDEKKQILKIKNGPAFRGAKTQELFIVENNKARKVKINKGLTNSSFVEITSPEIKEGQLIIISDTKDYDHLDEFTLVKEDK